MGRKLEMVNSRVIRLQSEDLAHILSCIAAAIGGGGGGFISVDQVIERKYVDGSFVGGGGHHCVRCVEVDGSDSC